VRISRGIRVIAIPTAIFRRTNLKSAIRIGFLHKGVSWESRLYLPDTRGLGCKSGMELEGKLLKLAVKLARNKSVSPLERRGNNNKTSWRTK
jgi:hypothetical protein